MSIICEMSNSSVVPRIMYVKNGDSEMLVTNISISSKNRMTKSTLFVKFNLYGPVIAWIQVAHTKKHTLDVLMCVRVNDGDLETITVLIS